MSKICSVSLFIVSYSACPPHICTHVHAKPHTLSTLISQPPSPSAVLLVAKAVERAGSWGPENSNRAPQENLGRVCLLCLLLQPQHLHHLPRLAWGRRCFLGIRVTTINRSLTYFHCHQRKYYIWCCLVAKSCLTLCDPMDCSPQESSVHGISQAWLLEWVAISFSRGSSWRSYRTCVICLTSFTTKSSGKPMIVIIYFVNIPCTFENKEYSAVVGWRVLQVSIRSSFLRVMFTFSLLADFYAYCSITERWVLKFSTLIIGISICHFSSVSFYFIYFGALF